MVSVMVTEVKKKQVSFVHKNLDKINPSIYKEITSWKDRSGKNLIIGVTLSWTDYENNPQTKDIVIVTDKGIKDADIDTWITNTICNEKEITMQRSRVNTLKSEIITKDVYEVS
jgi:hypothetical protein